MKRIFYYAFVFAAMMSCAKREEPPSVKRETVGVYESGTVNGHKITKERAADIAARRLGKDPLVTKSTGAPTVTAIIDTDTLLHIVNFPDDAGYALVSTDDRQSEVLAYSERGNFAAADTVGNDVIKFHVDMIMAYERNKREQIALGTWEDEEVIEVPDSEFDDLEAAILTEGGVSLMGATGAPGMPGAMYNSWYGNENTIALAKRRYPDLNNFGTPVSPPVINFPTEGVPGDVPVPCQTPPYCNPPIFSYDQYYNSYGCTYEKNISYTYTKGKLVVQWDQDGPLNKFCKNGAYDAGCAAIAVGQIMVHHRFPSKIPNNSNLKFHGTPLNMDSIAMFQTNSELAACGNQNIIDQAAKLVRALGDVMDLTYASGTGMTSAIFGNGKVEKAFRFFGYNVPAEGFWPYDGRHVYLVRESITNGNPVFVIGFTDGTRFHGHCWVIDGYRYPEITRQTFYFDEYGRYTGKKTTKHLYNNGEVHCAFGQWKLYYDIWMSENVYTFMMGDTKYDTHIRFLPNVSKP